MRFQLSRTALKLPIYTFTALLFINNNNSLLRMTWYISCTVRHYWQKFRFFYFSRYSITTHLENTVKKFIIECPGSSSKHFWVQEIIFVHRCGASGSMRASHAAGPGSIPSWDRFPGWGFFGGFSSPVRLMSGNFRPPRSPNIIWPSSSSFHIRLVGITECVFGVYCLSCLCCLGGGPGIGLITHPGRPSMLLCGQNSVYLIQR